MAAGSRFACPGPGTYSLDVKRIGVKRIRLAPFTVTEGESRLIDISVEPLPAVLSSVNVTGRTSCVRNPQTNARTAALWEDARAALTAAVITRSLSAGRRRHRRALRAEARRQRLARALRESAEGVRPPSTIRSAACRPKCFPWAGTSR